MDTRGRNNITRMPEYVEVPVFALQPHGERVIMLFEWDRLTFEVNNVGITSLYAYQFATTCG